MTERKFQGEQCKQGQWVVTVGGAPSVRGVRCYNSKKTAKAAIKRLRKKYARTMLAATYWLFRK